MTTALDTMQCEARHGDASLVSDYATAQERVREFCEMRPPVPRHAIADVLAGIRTYRACCPAARFADYLLCAAARAYVPSAHHIARRTREES